MEYEDICFISMNEAENKEITPLSSSFVEDIRACLKELEEEIRKCKNPRSKEYLMLADELNTAIDRVEEIFFLRRNKIFSMAAQASQTGETRHKNYDKLLPAEKKMYDSIIQAGDELKRAILKPIVDPDPEPEPEPEPEQETKEQAINEAQASPELLTVRILKDLNTFQGIDGRAYTVKTDDIISLPTANANGLIKRNAATAINLN